MGFTQPKIKIIQNFELKIKLAMIKLKNQFYTSYAESFQLPSAV